MLEFFSDEMNNMLCFPRNPFYELELLHFLEIVFVIELLQEFFLHKEWAGVGNLPEIKSLLYFIFLEELKIEIIS